MRSRVALQLGVQGRSQLEHHAGELEPRRQLVLVQPSRHAPSLGPTGAPASRYLMLQLSATVGSHELQEAMSDTLTSAGCPRSTSGTAPRRCSTTPLWSGQLARLGGRPAPPHGDPDRLRALGVRAGDALGAAAPGTPLVYDFGGFAQRYYEMTYDDPGRERARGPGRGDDAGHRAGPPARQPRARPRRLGAAARSCTRTPTSRCCRCRCPPTTPTGCSSSAGGCARCATRAC